MKEKILKQLPYGEPFLFVDEILAINEEGCEGTYTFKEDEFFYAGHFVGNPVTPGVILTECMAQIGLVSLGLYFLLTQNAAFDAGNMQVAFTESNIQFLKAVYPKEKVRVKSTKKYWRMGKLKCDVEMFDAGGIKLAHGTLAGIIKSV